MEIIDINTTQLLPAGVKLYGPMTPDEFQIILETVKGRVFRLTRQHPKPYAEYYIQPDEPAKESNE